MVSYQRHTLTVVVVLINERTLYIPDSVDVSVLDHVELTFIKGAPLSRFLEGAPYKFLNE